MIIGLDGSRAFLKYRTGIEEYSYQVIKHLRSELPQEAEVRVYVRKKLAFENGRITVKVPVVDFSFPKNWTLVGLWAPRFWTQIRFSLEMLFHPADRLLIPAHTVPVIHPKHTTVVVHGLEYEMSPRSYSAWERLYMRTSIKYSVRAAHQVIAVSENTKHDLQILYKVPAEKITVVYEGFVQTEKREVQKEKTILFIGRLEERKNVRRIIEAFEKLKKNYQIPHALVLVGKRGYGYEAIEKQINESPWKRDIQELGYVSLEEKQDLLKRASVFVFPSLYEGFGLPILEAQAAGTPVVTSSTSSLPEVAGEGALYVNPENTEDIAEKLYSTISLEETHREDLVMKGYQNLERFSWEKCAEEIKECLMKASL